MQTSPSRVKKDPLLVEVFITYEDALKVNYTLDPKRTLELTLWDLALNHLPINVGALSRALKQNTKDTICSNYSLRIMETLELITDEQIQGSQVPFRSHLRLCPGPKPLAASMLSKLDIKDNTHLKRILFELEGYFREDDFLSEFMSSDGEKKLLDMFLSSSDAETSMHILKCISILIDKCDHLITNVSIQIISKVFDLFASDNSIESISIVISFLLRYITQFEVPSNDSMNLAQNSKLIETYNIILEPNSVCIRKLVHYITCTIAELQENVLRLINAIIARSDPKIKPDLMRRLDSVGIRRAVSSLHHLRNNPVFSNLCLEFQNAVFYDYRRGSQVMVDMNVQPHRSALDDLWDLSGLEDTDTANQRQWERLGFMSCQPELELKPVGVLGLASIHFFAKRNQVLFKELIRELELHPLIACPFATAGIITCKVLLDTWGVSKTDYYPRHFLPFFLLFEETFSISFESFMNLWKGMGATRTPENIERVKRLFAFHTKLIFQEVTELGISDLTILRKNLIGIPFSAIRDRFLRENVIDSRLGYTNQLTLKKPEIARKSVEFVKSQRIACLVQGAWFDLPTPKSSKESWHRFCRLNENRSMLLYNDFASSQSRTTPTNAQLNKTSKPRFSILDDEIHKIKALSTIIVVSLKDIVDATTFPGKPLNIVLVSDPSPKTSPSLDLQCRSQTQFSEWIDGLSIILQKDITFTPFTIKLIDSVTQKNLTVAALNLFNNDLLRPDMLQHIPQIPRLPPNFDFWYKEKCMDPVLNIDVITGRT